MELQVVSDATGMSVKPGAPAVSTVFQSGCNGFESQRFRGTHFSTLTESAKGRMDGSTSPVLSGASISR